MSKDEDPDKGADLYAIVTSNRCLKWSAEDRIRAVMLYVAEGSLPRVAKMSPVPYTTLLEWRYRHAWWPAAVAECRRRKQDELDAKLTGIIDRATDEISDRVENGDAKIDRKGDKIKVPMQGKELAVVAGILFDKRAAIRGDPINIKQSNSDDQLQKLERKFMEFAKTMKESGNLAKPVNEEDVSGD